MPLETWKAKNPSNQRTMRTAAINPSMSSTPFTFERAPRRNPLLTRHTDTSRQIPCLWPKGWQIREMKSVRYESHRQVKPERGFEALKTHSAQLQGPSGGNLI